MKSLAEIATRLCGLVETEDITHEAFNQMALELFALQMERNAAYRALCGGRKSPRLWEEIPAVPTAAFKELELTSIPATEPTNE